MDCTQPDNKDTWTWLVLQGDVWQRHGKSVAYALYFLPSSFERPPRNIIEKLTSGYKAWEFLLYLYSIAWNLGFCMAFFPRFTTQIIANSYSIWDAIDKPTQHQPGQYTQHILGFSIFCSGV